MKEGYDRGLSAKRVRSGPLNFVEIQRGRLRLPPLPPLGHGGGAAWIVSRPPTVFLSPLLLSVASQRVEAGAKQPSGRGRTALRSAEPLGLGDRSGRLTHS